MKIRTFKKWNKKGFRIIPGSKAIGFNKNGKPLFLESQVYKAVKSSLENYYDKPYGEFVDAFGIDHSDVAGLPEGY